MPLLLLRSIEEDGLFLPDIGDGSGDVEEELSAPAVVECNKIFRKIPRKIET